jgi:8-oxo-dGTP pyrophosphatase MutT (NUDIX family)
MIDWLTFLKNQITNELPGERAQVEMMPMRGLSSDALKKANNAKESAVAIHLLQKEKGIEILLTQRNTYEGAHSGQISFPGGKRDASDEDSIHTARRESFEEIAMPFENGELIGPMTEIYIPVSNFHVKPYVFFHSELTVELVPDPREVASIFLLPGVELIDKKLRTEVDIPIGNGRILKDVPCFLYENRIIWGATAILLNELKEILSRRD